MGTSVLISINDTPRYVTGLKQYIKSHNKALINNNILKYHY